MLYFWHTIVLGREDVSITTTIIQMKHFSRCDIIINQLLIKYVTSLPFLWEVGSKESKIHVYLKEILQKPLEKYTNDVNVTKCYFCISLSCCVFVAIVCPANICYNFIHHCTKFQTGKIKLLPENDKKLFLCF